MSIFFIGVLMVMLDVLFMIMCMAFPCLVNLSFLMAMIRMCMVVRRTSNETNHYTDKDQD
jgi:hypothetical protein